MTVVRARAKVEYYHEGLWVFHTNVIGANDAEAEATGFAVARGLWRQGVAGVKVTVITDKVVLEKLR